MTAFARTIELTAAAALLVVASAAAAASGSSAECRAALLNYELLNGTVNQAQAAYDKCLADHPTSCDSEEQAAIAARSKLSLAQDYLRRYCG